MNSNNSNDQFKPFNVPHAQVYISRQKFPKVANQAKTRRRVNNAPINLSSKKVNNEGREMMNIESNSNEKSNVNEDDRMEIENSVLTHKNFQKKHPFHEQNEPLAATYSLYDQYSDYTRMFIIFKYQVNTYFNHPDPVINNRKQNNYLFYLTAMPPRIRTMLHKIYFHNLKNNNSTNFKKLKYISYDVLFTQDDIFKYRIDYIFDMYHHPISMAYDNDHDRIQKSKFKDKVRSWIKHKYNICLNFSFAMATRKNPNPATGHNITLIIKPSASPHEYDLIYHDTSIMGYISTQERIFYFLKNEFNFSPKNILYPLFSEQFRFKENVRGALNLEYIFPDSHQLVNSNLGQSCATHRYRLFYLLPFLLIFPLYSTNTLTRIYNSYLYSSLLSTGQIPINDYKLSMLMYKKKLHTDILKNLKFSDKISILQNKNLRDLHKVVSTQSGIEVNLSLQNNRPSNDEFKQLEEYIKQIYQWLIQQNRANLPNSKHVKITNFESNESQIVQEDIRRILASHVAILKFNSEEEFEKYVNCLFTQLSHTFHRPMKTKNPNQLNLGQRIYTNVLSRRYKTQAKHLNRAITARAKKEF